MILLVLLFLIAVAIFRGLSSTCVVANDRAAGEAAFQELKRNRDITMDKIAKDDDVYYNRVIHTFERGFHYDGTAKYPGAKPLPHR